MADYEWKPPWAERQRTGRAPPLSTSRHGCPSEIQESLQRYVANRIPTGGFLEAVLCNDLRGAVERADYINIRLIPEIVAYCYNNIPAACWGSPANVRAWLGGEDDD